MSVKETTLILGVSFHAFGEGETGRLVRSKDWSETALGPIASWTKSLKSHVSMMLALPSPTIIFWGEERIQIYNDGYAVNMGPRHPHHLGSTFLECWPEVHSLFDLWMKRVTKNAEAISVDRFLIELTRHGFTEECYFNFTFSPLRDDDGQIGGLIQIVTEVTDLVLFERRQEMLKAISISPQWQSFSIQKLVNAFSSCPNDIRFAILYLSEGPTENLNLVAHCGVGDEVNCEIKDVQNLTPYTPIAPWPDSTQTAVAIPIQGTDLASPKGVVVFGISLHLQFEEKYLAFLIAVGRELEIVLAAEEKFRQKQTKYEELQVAEGKFRSLVERAPDAFVIVNESGCIEVVNKQVENWFGYERADLVGKPIEILLPARFKSKHVSLRTHYTDLPKTRPMGGGLELFAQRKDGSEFPVEISLSPIQTPKGKLITSIIRDISVRKETEKKAARVFNLLNLALRSAQIGTWCWDICTNQIEWDGHMGKLLGVKTEKYSPTLSHFLSMIDPEDLPNVIRALNQSVETKVPYKFEYRIIWPDKSIHYLSACGETSYGSDGSPQEMTGVCWEITVQKLAFLELEDFKKNLEKQVQLRTEELRRSETQLRLVTDNVPALISYIDADQRYQYINAEYEKLLGKSRKEVIGRPFKEIVGEKVSHVLFPYITEGLSGRATAFELEVPYINGTRFVSANYVPDTDALGHTRGLFVLITDVSHIKRSEEKLRKSELKFRRIFESDLVGLMFWNLNGGIVDANDSFLKSFGYTREDLENGNVDWRKMTPSEWDEVDQIALKQVATTGVAKAYEKEFLGKDGIPVPIVIGAAALYGISEIVGIAYMLDISERKQVERERNKIYEDLEKSEENYRLIVESVQDHAIYLLDPEGTILSWNASAEEIKGYKPEEVIGKNFSLFYSQEDIEKQKPHHDLEIAAEAGKFEDEDLRVRKDGSKFWATVVISAIRNEREELKGFVKISRDITKRNENARALKTSNEKLEMLVKQKTSEIEKFRVLAEAIPQLCWIAEPDGYISWYNQRWYQYTGTTSKDMEGGIWQRVLDQQILPNVLGKWQNAIRTGEPIEMEFPIRSADGQFRWFLTRVLPLRNSQKEIVNWFGTNTDIDDQRRALQEREELLANVKMANDQLEQKIQDRTKELQRSNKELEQFAYIASHDLQTPLRHITSYVQLLTEKVKKIAGADAQNEKWTKYIVSGTQQMKTLITDLLTYSRVGRADVAIEKVAMSEVYRDVLEALREPIRKSNAQMSCAELPIVCCVRSQVKQLLQNLFENALKFKDPTLAPVVKMTFEEQDGYWKFCISDNGIGMDPKYFERIFIPFQRLHSESEYVGTGIGLAICKKIVEFHGGEIGVESQPGKGSKFFFSISKST